jgi:MYXO-CTERM domain-containing protein
VENGGVLLGAYAAIDWVLGNESTADETFSGTEQTLVAAYLAAGGSLFVSGDEIGWDLDAQGSAADRAFYNGPLQANYVADDSNDYSVTGVAMFSGLAFDFDGGSGSSYTVGYPDVIEPAPGAASVPVLEYSAGITAGVASSNVIVLGFPFETIEQESARTAMMEASLRALAPAYTGVNPNPPGGGGSNDDGGGSGGDSGCAIVAGGATPLVLFALLLWRRRR